MQQFFDKAGPRTSGLITLLLCLGLFFAANRQSAFAKDLPSPVAANAATVPQQNEDAPAIVNVAHFASFANSVDATSVTVRVNGGDAISDFKFGEIAKGVELPAGEYAIEILPSGTNTVAVSGTAMLESGVRYTLAAIGNGSQQPLELFALVDDTAADADNAKVRIAHLAPFADSLDGTKVDICTDDGTAILEGVPYKAFTDPYLTLPAGDYNLLIALAGTHCEGVALDLPSLRLHKGEIVDVFAIGDIENQPLQAASVTGFTLTPPPADPAIVNVAHFASFANSVDATSVMVRVNGGDAISDFKFGDIAKGVELPAGEYTIEILPSGTNTVAISGTAMLESGVRYTLAAIGNGSQQPLELFALVDDTAADANNAKVRIAHLAPFADSLDGTKVDICTDDGTAILEGVPYKAFTDPYLTLPAGDYNLLIALAGTHCEGVALDLPSLRLHKGEIVDVFAIGDIENQPLQAASVTGFTLTPEEPARTTITIRVDAQPDSIRNFRFDGDLGEFRLDDPGRNDGDRYRHSKTFDVEPGSYNVDQRVPYRWILSDIVCEDADAAKNVETYSVAITVEAGKNALCTFTNQRVAFLRVQKYHDTNGDGVRIWEPSLPGWTLSLYNGAGDEVGAEQTNQYGKIHFNYLAPGTYTVCEEVRDGWTNTQPGITNSEFGNRPCYTVDLAPRAMMTLLFGNTDSHPITGAAIHTETIVNSLDWIADSHEDMDDDGYEANGSAEDLELNSPAMTGSIYLPLIER